MDKEMSLVGHLTELRQRIIVIFISIAAMAAICYVFFDVLLKVILVPLGNQRLVYLNLTEPFIARFKLALWTGFFLTFPITTYETLAFLAPALKKQEKKVLIFTVCLVVPLFIAGALFGYFVVLPVAIKWLVAQGGALLKQNLTVNSYISFSVFFLIIFGITFEVPVIVWLLSKLNIVNYKSLLKNWRIALIIILFVAALITPDWSPITMIFVAIPAFVLYGLGVVLARYF